MWRRALDDGYRVQLTWKSSGSPVAREMFSMPTTQVSSPGSGSRQTGHSN